MIVYNKTICKNKKIAIFGAGTAGKNLIGFTSKSSKPKVIFDNNQKLIGEFLMGIPIAHPSAIHEYDFDYIVIASSFEKDIFDQLSVKLKIPNSKILYSPFVLNNNLEKFLFLVRNFDLFFLLLFLITILLCTQ